jgi:hypothetical protein
MPRFLAELLARLRSAAPSEPSPEDVITLVHEVLDILGAPDARDDDTEDADEDGADWSVQVGSARLEIGLHHNPVLDEPTLEVSASILRLPPHNLLAFYRRCLELNRIVVGCSIGVDRDVVVVAAERRLPGLDKSAVVEMLLNVASAADQFDDELAAEFDAEKLGQD